MATEEWSPATEMEVPPIIRLEDEDDRILGFTTGVTRDFFLDKARGGLTTHSATLGRRYRGATISDGAIYAGRGFSVIRPRERRSSHISWSGTPIELGTRIFATNWVSEQYFGHWLLDGLSLELLAAERGMVPIGLARQPWLQEQGYRAATNLALHRASLAHVRDLWIVDDRGMNAGRINRMRELRQRIRGVAPSVGQSPPVFLRRIGGARRLLTNQDSLADALARRGFAILTPENEPVKTLRAALRDAKLVISVEGSALCHAVAAMADGGTIVAIQPPHRVDWIQKVWTDCTGLRLAQTVADDAGHESFNLPEDRLLRLCDRIAAENAY